MKEEKKPAPAVAKAKVGIYLRIFYKGMIVDLKEEVEIEDIPEGPTDPFEQAVAAKNRGNKYFRGGR